MSASVEVLNARNLRTTCASLYLTLALILASDDVRSLFIALSFVAIVAPSMRIVNKQIHTHVMGHAPI